jgi:hypothetical protein
MFNLASLQIKMIKEARLNCIRVIGSFRVSTKGLSKFFRKVDHSNIAWRIRKEIASRMDINK